MIYEIKNTGVIVSADSKGAELVSLIDYSGIEYMWQKDEKYWDGCSPVLFPIVGRLEEGKYFFDGKSYDMPLHGFLRGKEFKLIHKSDNKMMFSFSSDEDTKKIYPFDFNFIITYTLEEYSLNVKFEITNTGNEKMPFSVGAHPGFNVPLQKNERFEDYRIIFEKEENTSCPQVDENYIIDFSKEKKILNNEKVLMLDHELFKNDALIFHDLKSEYLILESIKSGRGVKIDFKKFPYLGVWQFYSDDTPFLCIEPWHGMGMCSDDTDFLNKRGMICLEKGKTFSIDYEITII